jgi:hypothetical protein
MARAPKDALIAIPSTLAFITPAWALGYAVTSIDTWPQDNDRGGRRNRHAIGRMDHKG